MGLPTTSKIYYFVVFYYNTMDITIRKKGKNWKVTINYKNVEREFIVNVSNRKDKKYDVYENNKYLISFGSSKYQQFMDKFGHYKHLNHNDLDRRQNYFKRFGYTDNINSAKFWSNNFLW